MTAFYFQGGSRLKVVNCAISDVPNAGIRVSPNAAKTVLISHTSVTDTVTGIFLQPLGGAMSAMLDHVTTNNDRAARSRRFRQCKPWRGHSGVAQRTTTHASATYMEPYVGPNIAAHLPNRRAAHERFASAR